MGVNLKIAHIADTHIRNYNYHKEYREIFESIYDRLREEKVDYIVHCGDLAHTKTQLSPEYFDLATEITDLNYSSNSVKLNTAKEKKT